MMRDQSGNNLPTSSEPFATTLGFSATSHHRLAE
jgi:hypothetical protein